MPRVWLGLLLTLGVVSHAVAQEGLEEFLTREPPVRGRLDSRSVVRASCARAGVVLAEKDALRSCRAARSGDVEVLVASAERVKAEICAQPELPFDLVWATGWLKDAQAAYDKASAERAERATESAGLEAAVAQAKLKLEAAQAAQERSAAADATSRAMDARYTDLINDASPRDFETFLEDEPRRIACRKVNDAMLAAYAEQTAAAPTEPQREREFEDAADQSRDEAHASDLMRKAPNTATVLTTALGRLESPGAPDAVAFSILTALGADEETTGTQVLLTLNVAKLFHPVEKERLAMDVAWRNLFVRAMLPLETTENRPITPAAAPEGVEGGTSAEVTRFQFVVGTSLFDESDPRIEANDACYRRVIEYLPYAPDETRDAQLLRVRTSLFDVCHRRVAAQQRLALRAGVGLQRAESTVAEVLAAALVYAPASQVYFNLFYQRLLEPKDSTAHNFGFGVSLADNIGGAPSGVNAWARVGVDVSWLVSIPDRTDEPVLEARVLPKLSFKLGDSVASLGIGPRIARMDREDSDVGVLAEVSLTYDADQLIDPLLTPVRPAAP